MPRYSFTISGLLIRMLSSIFSTSTRRASSTTTASVVARAGPRPSMRISCSGSVVSSRDSEVPLSASSCLASATAD